MMASGIRSAAAAVLLVSALPATADEAYPTRPIRLVVPFPAAGPTDVVARTVGARMGALLGQPLLIDNRAGAGGSIGSHLAATAPADGYTILIGPPPPHPLNTLVPPTLPYHPARRFAPSP